MIPFTTTTYEGEFSRTISYKVHGFWSGDSVSISQYKDIETRKWGTPKVNWSVGGRDIKEEPDSLIAAECFAKAIFDAIKQAKKWKP